MHYSRPTLVSNWHNHREAEPKDYDFTLCTNGQKKTLSISTYKNFGTYMDADWTTSTEAQMSQHLLREQNQSRRTPKSMVQADHFHSADFDRRFLPSMESTGQMASSILPSHPPVHSQIELNSTYAEDYLPPWPRGLSKEEVRVKRQTDSQPDFRKRQSQFTDTANHHRTGRNTWQDESGIYFSLGSRAIVHSRPTNPISP